MSDSAKTIVKRKKEIRRKKDVRRMKKNVLGKKITKGNPGYLDYQKKIEIFRTILYFAIVAALFGLGYSQTHSNKNLLTIVAVV